MVINFSKPKNFETRLYIIILVRYLGYSEGQIVSVNLEEANCYFVAACIMYATDSIKSIKH